MKTKYFTTTLALLVWILLYAFTLTWGQQSQSYNLVRGGFANTGGQASSSNYLVKESALGTFATGRASSAGYVLMGALVITTVDDPAAAEAFRLPKEFSLRQNYPNPFNPETTIEYELPQPAKIRLVIYDAMGREVRDLIDLDQQAGVYRVQWDARDNQGRPQPSGIYFYKISTGKFVEKRKMLLLQ